VLQSACNLGLVGDCMSAATRKGLAFMRLQDMIQAGRLGRRSFCFLISPSFFQYQLFLFQE
jgi:hypothetical protein